MSDKPTEQPQQTQKPKKPKKPKQKKPPPPSDATVVEATPSKLEAAGVDAPKPKKTKQKKPPSASDVTVAEATPSKQEDASADAPFKAAVKGVVAPRPKNPKQKKKPPASDTSIADAASCKPAAAEIDAPLFPAKAPGKRPDYGTNNTLELLERIPSQIVDMKLDDVLTAVKDVDNMCDHPRCKAKVSLIGHTCELCRKRYCFKHALPEVHGCGEAVKKEEREKFLHPKTGKTIRQEMELAQAKKKLQSKLKDMQVQRMQKTTGGGDNIGASGSGGGAKKKKGK